MYTKLPESPVRKIHKCHHCGDVSVRFYDPTQDRAYTAEEWEKIVIDGNEALYRILQSVRENPVFFANE